MNAMPWAFVVGASLVMQAAHLPSLGAALAVTVVGFALLAWRGHAMRPLRVAAALGGLVGCVAAGAAWTTGQAQWRLADALPEADAARDLEVVGVVASMPTRTERGWRFRFDVERTVALDGHVPAHVVLTWFDARRAAVRAGAPSSPAQVESRAAEGRPGDAVDRAVSPVVATASPVLPGERWRFTVRLKRPHGAWNPHGFDAEAWWLERGVRATGWVRPGGVRLDDGRRGLRHPIEAWRTRLRDGLAARLGDAPYAGVVIALALGEQDAIPASQWAVFTRTGVNHLLSLSGLHITLWSALVYAAVLRGWRRVPPLARRVPAQVAAAAIGWGASAAYALLAGFAVPAQRTVVMLGVVGLGLAWRSQVDPLRVLAVAAASVVAFDPFAVRAPGFWLSFGAVAWLMLAVGDAAGRTPAWRTWARTQWVLSAGLAPFTLLWFQQVSLVAPVANAFAVPLVSFVVVPLALLALLAPWTPLAQAAATAMTLVAAPLERLARFDAALWTQPAPALWATALGLIGIAWALAPRGVPARAVGWVLCVPMFLPRLDAVASGEARVTLLDVGQGLAAVVRTRHATLLFDAGPAWSNDTDAGARIVLPWLRGEGVSHLSMLVASHDDADHTGGVGSVLALVPTTTVLTSVSRGSALLADAPRVVHCAAGQSWDWDGVRFELLHPAPRSYTESMNPDRPPVKDNATSCMLRVSVGAHAVLLTADAERDVEARLVAAGAPLRADLLVVGHHGSRTSTSPPFLQAVAPREAWIPVGARNRFGHPHPDVTRRLAAADVVVRRSDRDGALEATLRADGLTPTVAWRGRAPRWWHDR
jgi:competence protein ComEC